MASLVITILTLLYSLRKIWQIQKSLKAVKLKTIYTLMHFVCVFLLLLQWISDLVFFNLSKSYNPEASCGDESAFIQIAAINGVSDTIPIEMIVDIFLLGLILKIAREDSDGGPTRRLVLIKGI